MADEEEEALRLQREAAAALRPEDFEQSEGEGDESSEEESGGWAAGWGQGASWAWGRHRQPVARPPG